MAIGSVGVFMNVSINSSRGPPMRLVTAFPMLAAFYLILPRILPSGYYHTPLQTKKMCLEGLSHFPKVTRVSKQPYRHSLLESLFLFI